MILGINKHTFNLLENEFCCVRDSYFRKVNLVISEKTTGMVPDIIAFLEIVGGARESQNQKRKRDTVEFTLTKSCEQIRKKAVSNENRSKDVKKGCS